MSADSTTLQQVRRILAEVLSLELADIADSSETGLFGVLPELDSMAVVSLLTQIEQDFRITIHDDEISADAFATLGSLSAFIEQKQRP